MHEDDRPERRGLNRRVVVTAGVGLTGTLAAGGLLVARADPLRPVSSSTPVDTDSWSPLTITGCDFWLDATQITIPVGTAIARSSAIVDLAGSGPIGPEGTITPVLQPGLFGDQPGIVFGGQSGLWTAAADSPSAATYLVVLQQNTLVPGAVLGSAASDSPNGFELRINSDGTVSGTRSGVWDIGTSTRKLSAGRANIVVFQYDSNGIWACFINGESAGMGRTKWSFAAPTRLSIGSSSASGTDTYTGAIAEVIRWNRPLTGSELRDAHDALGSKWGVSVARPISAATPNPLRRVTGLKGSNIAPKLSMYTGGSVWTTFWEHWDWNWVRGCIDRAVDAGSTAIRTIGDVQAVASGRLTQQQYLDQLDQVIKYCSSAGIRYYPCGFSLQAIGDASTDDCAAQLAAQARLFALAEDTVIGFDLVNELASNYGSRGTSACITFAQTLADAVRAAAPTLSITVSDIGDLQWGALSRGTPISTYRQLAGHLDFFDIHVYADTADLRPWQLATYELGSDRPLIIGEFGVDATKQGDDGSAAYYEQVRRMRQVSPTVAGVFQWAAVDDAFGLISESGNVARSATIAEWQRF